MATETRATWCGLCHARCGLELEIEEGRAVGMRGDPAHPTNAGRTCERGRLLLEHLYHPDRLNHPLKRVGQRGSGQWERVGWDQALEEIAAQLAALREDHGAETLAVTRGTYRTYHWDARRFLNLFGSPNLTGANPICHCPTVCVESALMGASPSGDRSRSACLVIWGSARSVSSRVTDWHAIRSAHKRGAKIIVVDPRRTAEAELADLWLPVRPGTDLALLLAWIHVICEEDLLDHDFLQRHTDGFGATREMARDVDPDTAARITGLDAEDIRRAARLYATTRPGVITWGQGLDKQGPDTDGAIQARTALRAITGNLDVEGGERLGLSTLAARAVSDEELECNDALHPDQRALMLGGARHRIFGFGRWERVGEALGRLPSGLLKPHATADVVTAHPNAVYGAILHGAPYRVRALICQAANPLLTLADPERTLASLRALELLVVMDCYQTPTSALADYVLPAASTVERDDLSVVGSGLIAHPRALEPMVERRSDYELWMELGRRLGQAERWPWDTAEQVCEHRLSNTGITWAELCERRGVLQDPGVGRFRKHGFGTPSGKVELYSTVLSDLGCNPLPRFIPPPDSERQDEDRAWPLLIITGSSFNPMYHSEGRQWPTARRRCPDPTVTLHPDTAAEHDIAEGDWVRIESARGAIRQRAHVDPGVGPGVVDCQHGWWFPEREPGQDPPFGALESNANVLCGDDQADCAPGTGAWRQTGIPGRIARIAP